MELSCDQRVTLERARSDPVWFCREVLGVEPWSKQIEILESVRDHKKTAVKSGNNVGKTYVAAVAILWFLFTHAPAKVLSTSTTFDQVRLRLWRDVRRLHRQSRIPLGGELLETMLKVDGDGWEAVGLSTDRPDNFQGLHAEHILLVFDEAQGVEREIWEAAESMMGSAGARWLAIANPMYTTGEFWEAMRRPDEWHPITISCLDHPNVAAERAGLAPPYPAAVTLGWIEERRQKWGEGSPLWKCRVEGQFPPDGTNTLIPLGLLELNADRVFQGLDERHMGVDIARYGDDSNVACLLENRRVTKVESWSGVSTMPTAGRIQHFMKLWGVEKAHHVHIDVIGVGGGVVDRLRELGLYVDACNFGEGPVLDWTGTVGSDMLFKNRRAELYWVARSLLQQKQLSVPREFGEMWAELVQPMYEFDSAGRVVIEPKEEIKKRIGRSPDFADALILALSRSADVRMPWVLA